MVFSGKKIGPSTTYKNIFIDEQPSYVQHITDAITALFMNAPKIIAMLMVCRDYQFLVKIIILMLLIYFTLILFKQCLFLSNY